MKKLVGKREKVDPDLKITMALVETFMPNGPSPTAIEFHETCAGCKAPLVISLREDITTGEIWLEGPDLCDKCNHQLSNNKSEVQLSQEAIFGFFGKY